MHLVQRPLPLMVGGEDGNEHIGVVPDLVQVKVVFVVGMGALVGVQVVLQLRLHPGIGVLRAQHGLVGGGIGGAGDAGHTALYQHGTGGHAVEEERDSQKQARSDQEALFVPPGKIRRLTALFRRRLCRLGRVRGSLPHGGGGLSGAAGGGILPLDSLLLLPAGKWAAGKAGVLLQALLIQGIEIGLFQLPLRRSRLAVGAQLMGAIPGPDQTPGAFCRLLCLMGALHSHIVRLTLPDFPMHRAQRRICRGIPQRMLELGGRLLVLKLQAHRDGPGLRVHGVLLDLPPGDLRLGLVRPGRRPVRFADGLFQGGVFPFLFRELQARLSSQPDTSWGLVVMIL